MDFLTNFMERLTKQSASPSSRTFTRQTRKIDRVNVNNPETLGRYQVLPINSVITEFPFVSGQVRQINMPRRRVDESGEEQIYNAWIHLPSSEFYQMKDSTGRVVSSLTADDEKLLSSAHNLWDELYKEVDGKTNYMTVKDFIRPKNITIFSGYCLNFWKYGSNNRTPDRQNFSALFVITTRNFIQSVETGIKDKTAIEGGDASWIEKVYNNKLKDRDGFLMFSINKDRNTKGFQASAQHEVGRSAMLSGIEIPAEDFEAGMDDPVSLFLGWQASNEDREKPSGSRRLFNASLIKEACDYMSTLLSVIRAEKASNPGTNIDIVSVAGKVSSGYFKGMSVDSPAPTPTPEPEPAPQVQDTPATHIDPLMGSQPASGFGGFGGFGNPNFGGAPSNQSSGTPF